MIQDPCKLLVHLLMSTLAADGARNDVLPDALGAACRARSQRLLESTWDDLLARQAAEVQAAEAFAAWIAPAATARQAASPTLPG